MPEVKTHILIIEDDQVDQMAFTRIIGKSRPSAIIKIAENIEEANLQLASNKFNWIISDYNLPDGTILDILSYSQDNPMICVSGETDELRINFLLSQGCKHFFEKDQHLNYLQSIVDVINCLKPSTLEANIKSNPFTLDAMKRQFGDDKQIIIELLEIFVSKGEMDLSELKNAIIAKSPKETQHLSHRIKSGYRVLGLISAVDILEKIENQVQAVQIDWNRLLEDMNKVCVIYADTKRSLPKLLQNFTADA